MLNSGEMVLNNSQQARLFALLNGMGGGGSPTINISGVIGGQEEVALWVQEGLERAQQMGKVAA
jgi:hypothetical protein